MTDTSSRPQSVTSSLHHTTCVQTSTPRTRTPQREADAPFLRRILFGLIAATVLSGAVTLALTNQYELFERFQVASAHGPA